jgi:high-affinity iron transporter
MLATLIIVFREIIEAGLVVGIVLAATRGVPRRGFWITGGIAGGTLGACIVAAFARTIGEAMEGIGQELLNALILLTAVFMLAWHNIWMARHGREISMRMKALGEDVSTGHRSLAALAVVVATAVLREGSEIVLFLYGIAISGSDTMATMATGGFLGLLLGACMSALMYLGLLRIPARHLFRVTSWLIALLAAGMAAQAVAFLQQADVVSALDWNVWNTSRFISDGSITGKILHTLIGYTDRPTAMQLLVYSVTLGSVFLLMRLFGHMPEQKKITASSSPSLPQPPA